MSRKLFVGNLSFDTTDSELEEAFSKAGACASAAVVKDRETGRPRGFGFVEMGSEEEARRAVSMLNGTQLGDRAINVSEARERSQVRPGGFRPGPAPRSFGPPAGEPGPRFRKDGGSRRGIRGRKRSL